MIDRNVAGPKQLSTGSSSSESRVGASGGLIIGYAHGRFHEAVSRGRVFSASMQAGAALGTVLTATAVTLTLYNPANSGYWLSLLKVSVAITTGLAAAGTSALVLAGNVNSLAAAPATNTAATVRNNLLGNATTGVGVAYTATTLPATPIVLRPSFSFRVIGATPVSEFAGVLHDLVDGEIIIAPNTCVTIQGIGSAISGIAAMAWEEIPIAA